MKKMTLALFLASLSFGTANADVCDTSACGSAPASLTLPQNPPVVAGCDNSWCGLYEETPVVQMKNLVADNCIGDYCNDGGGVRG
jgi:hypothetical protein